MNDYLRYARDVSQSEPKEYRVTNMSTSVPQNWWQEAPQDKKILAPSPPRAISNGNRQAYDSEESDTEGDIYDEDQLQFFQDIVDGRRRLDGDDPYWEMKAELSGNLGRLFGKKAKFIGNESDWQRPQTYGLGNSAPIIPTRFNAYVAEEKSSTGEASTGYKKSASVADHTVSQSSGTLFGMIQHRGVTYDEAVRSKTIRSIVDLATNDDNAEDDGDDDGDDDDDEGFYDDDEADDDRALSGMLNSTGLSPNLMALLGVNATPVKVETDWRPPERAGLDNSAPLVDRAQPRLVYPR